MLKNDLELAIDQFNELEIDVRENSANQAALLIAYSLSEQQNIGCEFELSDKATQTKLIEHWSDIISNVYVANSSQDNSQLDFRTTEEPREHRHQLNALLKKPMHMELLVGEIHYIGHTENISLNGALLTVLDTSTQPDIQNKQGKLWLELSRDNFVEFGCQVIHVSKHKIGIRFDHQDVKTKDILHQYVNDKL